MRTFQTRKMLLLERCGMRKRPGRDPVAREQVHHKGRPKTVPCTRILGLLVAKLGFRCVCPLRYILYSEIEVLCAPGGVIEPFWERIAFVGTVFTNWVL